MTWISYARNFEDVTLMRALRGVVRGFYLHVGARDPGAESVTRAFYELGWSGINIQPAAHWHARLADHRARDVNLRVAAGDRDGSIILYEVEGAGISTVDAALARRHRDAGRAVREFPVPMRTLDGICLEHGVREVHFLAVDVERAGEQVLLGLDPSTVRPWIIVIRATGSGSGRSVSDRWDPLLASRRYEFAWCDGLNRFYVAQEHAGLAVAISQPPSVLDDFVGHAEAILRGQVDGDRVRLARERERADGLAARVAALEADLAAVEARSVAHDARGHEQRARTLERVLREVLASRSWRLTAPLRYVAARLRGRPGDEALASHHVDSIIAGGRVGVSLVPAVRLENAASSRHLARGAGQRPRLAFVCPMPPVRSGIADFAAPLLPELARQYEVELVAPQDAVSPDRGLEAYPLRDLPWFEANAGSFQRIVYHVGNSLHHEHMLPLLERHGGTVVLHDLVMSDLLEHLERTGRSPGAFTRALLASHGYEALIHLRDHGVDAAMRRWPASFEVFRHADGVILVSPFALRQARAWWGDDIPAQAIDLPCPLSAEITADERAGARCRLGIPEDAFLACSFGVVHPSKLSHRLTDAWRASPLSVDPRAYLSFVGDCADPVYRERLLGETTMLADPLACVDASGVVHLRSRDGISVEGFTPHHTYRDWILAADVSIQLRSRGEASGAILDCLAAGVASIANANGPLADLPRDAVCLLDDEFSDAQLASVLTSLRFAPAERRALGDAARAYVAERHDPATVADAHARAIEGYARRARERRVASDEVGPRTLYVDVTALALHDLGSGVQRVVRSVMRRLLARGVWLEDSGSAATRCTVRVEPVRLNYGRYEIARGFAWRELGLLGDAPPDEPVRARRGDVFLGLDLVTDGVHQHETVFEQWRAAGMSVHFLVHDLLPVRHPEWFPEEAVSHFRGWLETIVRVSDSLVCNSRATAADVTLWLHEAAIARHPAVTWSHLGADLPVPPPVSGEDPAADALAARLAGRAAFLMVGTVEPRKGHTGVLDAFERLWAAGHDVDLVIVGRAGWQVDELVGRLRSHPEAGTRLIWLESASDALLACLYGSVRALIMASKGEGFGLPLVEAAQRQLPLLVRDLPVFRELAGDHAFWWSGDETLADDLLRWLDLFDRGHHPRSERLEWLDWDRATQGLLVALLGIGARLPATAKG